VSGPVRLLVFNLVTDADDPILGFTTRWLAALAEHCERIEVITMRAGRLALPSNVRVLSAGAERGFSEPRRALEFYRHLRFVLRTRVDACFSHMMPLFSAMAGPVLRARGIPIVTWYAHPNRHTVLKIAHVFSNRMVTSLPSTYPWRRDKLEVIGQGIDTELFSRGNEPDEPPLLLCVGRLSAVKDHPTLFRACARLRADGAPPFTVALVGDVPSGSSPRYADGLRRLAAELSLDDVVRFEGQVSLDQLPAWYRRCTVHVNLTQTGSGDKVVWEAMSCGRPCVVANSGFSETLGRYAPRLSFRYGDDAHLAACLRDVLALAPAERREIGSYLREQVERLHGLDRLARRIVTLCGSLSDRRTG
jgi:glycosyltransferase involved in cell wall biosynthesis